MSEVKVIHCCRSLSRYVVTNSTTNITVFSSEVLMSVVERQGESVCQTGTRRELYGGKIIYFELNYVYCIQNTKVKQVTIYARKNGSSSTVQTYCIFPLLPAVITVLGCGRFRCRCSVLFMHKWRTVCYSKLFIYRYNVVCMKSWRGLWKGMRKFIFFTIISFSVFPIWGCKSD